MDANIQLNINQTTLAQKKFLVGKSSVILPKNLKNFAVINAVKYLLLMHKERFSLAAFL